MQITYIVADRREEWNTFVAQEPSFALLQSWEWGEFKELLGWQAIRIGVEHQDQIVAGVQMLIKHLPLQLASVAYVPRGPLVNWQDQITTKLLLQAMHEIAREHKAIFLSIEPPLEHSPEAHTWLQNLGFRANSNTNQPRCTLVVDLKPNLDEIFSNLSKNMRKKLRATERKGVEVYIGDRKDLDSFYRIMQATGQRAGFSIRSNEYYAHEFQVFSKTDQIRLSMANYDGKTIAVDTTLTFGNKAASFHGGFLNEYPQLKSNHLLMWKAICWAKENGCDSFDLWGIPDEVGELVATGQPIPEDRTGDLWGVYYFKRAFAKQVIYYVGSYDYVYKPLIYRATMFATAQLGSLDRTAQRLEHGV